MPNILFIFHCSSNTGYAIKSLEASFLASAQKKVQAANVFFSYPVIENGNSDAFPPGFLNIIQFDPKNESIEELDKLRIFLIENNVKIIVGFDQPVHRLYYKLARLSGVEKIVSYWGAPMSSVNKGLKLFLKRLETKLHSDGPDLYIFESKAMALTATQGRGLSAKKVKVVYLGVDEAKFSPSLNSTSAFERFSIPTNRKIIFYSGHMESRKGVAVIMKAANKLVLQEKRDDVHFLLLGNQAGEEDIYIDMLDGSARDYVTFGGYRNDIDEILPSCYAGCIASIGWDSFTMSSLEMAACGLPLVVSDLQGLVETVENKKTGLLFETGNSSDLVKNLIFLLDNEEIRDIYSKAARERIINSFTKSIQINALAKHFF